MKRKGKAKRKGKVKTGRSKKIVAGAFLALFLVGLGMLIARGLAPVPQTPRGCCGGGGCPSSKK
jgi:hypothetical protein